MNNNRTMYEGKIYRRVTRPTAFKLYEKGVTVLMTANKLPLDSIYFHPFILDFEHVQERSFSFHSYVAEFKFYNCNSEVGYYPAFYVEESEVI